MTIKPAGRNIMIVAVIGVLFYLFILGPYSILPSRKPVASIIPKAVSLGKIANVQSNVAELPLPGTEGTTSATTNITFKLMAWNSQFPLMLANGGPSTTSGSLVEKYAHVNVNLIRLDDCNQMQAEQIAFAKALKEGNPNPDGPAFVAIMGDGGAQYLASINDKLKKYGDEYIAQIVGSAGYSYGEDGLWGPAKWKQNPKSMKGCVIVGVIRDGDWNIALKYAGDNGIANNPDETTYDPNAINWINAASFTEAPQKLIAGATEERDVVIEGKKTGEKRKIKAEGCVTWTPGDVMLAEQLGGLIPVVTTKQYAGQMPNAIIGIKKWMQDNRDVVEGMIQAIGEAGSQVKQYPKAIQRAGEISAEVYKETDRDATWWIKMYQGADNFVDKQGMTVAVGGSKPNNLADMVLLFGPAGLMKSTYTSFGNIVVQQYPKMYPKFPDAAEVIDGSYVMNVAKKVGTKVSDADQFKFDKTSVGLGEVTGKRKYSIQFATGSATISTGQESVLEGLKDELAVGLSLKVVIHGHTDNVGVAASNFTLSGLRARAVERWLETTYPDIFPEGRINTVAHGQNNPIGDNDSEAGRAVNRRVEIYTGTAK